MYILFQFFYIEKLSDMFSSFTQLTYIYILPGCFFFFKCTIVDLFFTMTEETDPSKSDSVFE